MRKLSLSLVVVALLLCVVAPSSATAAVASNDAIRVSPALSNLQLQPAQTDASVIALVTNLTPQPLTVVLSGKDFGALNQTGAVGFFGSSYNPTTNPHSLQSVMRFPVGTVYLAPHASQTVMISLQDVGSLAAGGHFGAVLFTPENSLSANAKTKVSIHSSIASLIFLTTASGGTQKLQLLTFHVSGLSFTLPTQNYIGFHNSGNTQSAVNGQLTLYGSRGNIVSTAVLNPGSGLILPDTSRVFPVTLPIAYSLFALPGSYHLRLQYRDGTQHVFTTVNEHFYYINLPFVGLLIVLVIFCIYGGKKWGKWFLRGCGRIGARLWRIFRKKSEPAVIPVIKKRRPPLIQG